MHTSVLGVCTSVSLDIPSEVPKSDGEDVEDEEEDDVEEEEEEEDV